MTVDRTEWLKAQIERAREREQVYKASRAVHGEMWTAQAEQMLQQMTADRMYLECVLEEEICLQTGCS